jgi:hypothetical protein
LIISTSRWIGKYVHVLKFTNDLAEASPSSRGNSSDRIILPIELSSSYKFNNENTFSWTSNSQELAGNVSILQASSYLSVFSDNLNQENHGQTARFNHCFALNSPSWLQGRRIGNAPVPDEWLDQMMQPQSILHEPNLQTILDLTLCYPNGNFRNVGAPMHIGWNDSDPVQIHAWEFRLLFLAIHRLLHVEAYPEYQARRNCGLGTSVDRTYTIGNFDYECPHSKFMVLTVNSGAGMGTTLRHGIIPSFYTALVTGRIPILLQSVDIDNVEGLPRFLSGRFGLASCPERRDWQCMFLPTTPCVLTFDDLRNASKLDGLALRDLRRRGALSSPLNEARVLLVDVSLTPLNSKTRIHENIRIKAYQAIMDLLNDWKKHQPQVDTEQRRVLSKAAEWFRISYSALTDEEGRSRKDRVFRAALFYLLRLNVRARQEVTQQLNTTMPPRKDNRQYFGLPIRGKLCHWN